MQMEMPDKPKCSQCGAPLSADAPGGLCLRCLLAFGLQSGDDTATHDLPPPVDEADSFPGYQILQRIGEGGCGVVYHALTWIPSAAMSPSK